MSEFKRGDAVIARNKERVYEFILEHNCDALLRYSVDPKEVKDYSAIQRGATYCTRYESAPIGDLALAVSAERL